MIKSLLQGRALGHPLHPALVHFPIGLFLFSVVLDVFSLLTRDTLVTQAASYTLVGGLLMALLTAIPGLVDYLDIRADSPARGIATRHLLFNAVAVVLFGASLVLRLSGPLTEGTPTTPLLLAVAGAAVILYSGYLGGSLIYTNGVSVGRHRRKTESPDKTIRPEASPDADGFVQVAPLETVRHGGTLRVERNGHVMAVVRQGDEVYAFQDFCTHRYVPLSEGTLQGYEIECPWHGSCFNIRTGQVTQGPAKVALKTYAARVADGQIQVRVPDRG